MPDMVAVLVSFNCQLDSLELFERRTLTEDYQRISLSLSQVGGYLDGQLP